MQFVSSYLLVKEKTFCHDFALWHVHSKNSSNKDIKIEVSDSNYGQRGKYDKIHIFSQKPISTTILSPFTTIPEYSTFHSESE